MRLKKRIVIPAALVAVLVATTLIVIPAQSARQSRDEYLRGLAAQEMAAKHAPQQQATIPPFPSGKTALQILATVWPVIYGNQNRISAIETTAAKLGVTVAPGATAIPATGVPTVGVPTPVPTSTVVPTVGVPTSPPGGVTNTPQPTVIVATVAPVPTMPGMGGEFGICGESNTAWHPPVITAQFKSAHPEMPALVIGCATEHEHGSPPPTWVEAFELARGRVLSFRGAHNTSSIENLHGAKHVAMKNYAGVLQTTSGPVDFFATLHGTEAPFERASIKHSARFWFRYQGAVSHMQFHADFGNPTDNERRFLRGRGIPDPSVRGLMLVTDRTSVANGVTFAQWYAQPGNPPWGVDYGLTFGNISTYYKRSEELGDVYDKSRWDINVGATGNTRRIELAWYANRTALRGIFWTTVLGDPVTGPTDPRCAEFPCVEQVIQPNLPEMSFATTGGKNAFQETYSDTGVKTPN